MQLYVVDAFTDEPFRGNPAGVALVDRDVTEGWMQRLAAELRHSETAFVRARPDGAFDLRWFTPAAEVDLCGHATLASAHVLATTGHDGPFRFRTRSGELTATATDGAIQLDFPALGVEPAAEPAGLAAALGVRPVGCYANGMDLLVEVADEQAVRALTPDVRSLEAVPCRGVIVTAPADPTTGGDFVSRFFAPRVGVDEDPVTGSAHCALAPFWAGRLGKDSLVGVQLSPRGGRVSCGLRGERVLLGGSAVTVLSGQVAAG